MKYFVDPSHRHKTGEKLTEHPLCPDFKRHTHKLYILRHCTNILFISILTLTYNNIKMSVSLLSAAGS